MIEKLDQLTPVVPASCFVHKTATIIGQVTLGENDLKNLDDVNKASTLYIKLQYHVIKVLYKQYTDRLFEILNS